MSILKMAVNVPMAVEHAKYLDVVAGKYGAQLRLKGTIGGDTDALLFLPGKVWANAKALKSAGVIPADAELPEEVEKPVEVTLLAKSFTLVNQQAPGQKYADLAVLPVNGPAPSPAANGKQAISLGPRIPEIDDEPYGATLPVPPKPAPAPAAAPAAGDPFDVILTRHARCLEHVVENEVRYLQSQNIVATGETVSALVAQLFIECSRRGL